MKRVTLSLFLIGVCLTMVQAQSFEGSITATHSLQPGLQTVYTIKGDKAVQVPQGPGLADVKVFSDVAANAYSLVVVYPGTTQVSSYSLVGSSRGVISPQILFTNVAATGAQKMIDGYSCEEYSGEVDGVPFTAWVSEDLASVNLKAHVTPQTFEQLPYAALPGVTGLVLSFSSTYSATNQAFEVALSVNAHQVDAATVTAPLATIVVD